MNKPPPKYDPPLIERTEAPILTRFRDVIFTTLAWAALLYLIRGPLYLLYDFLSYPHFAFSRFTAHDVWRIWLNISGFVYLAVFVVLWLVIWGIARRHDMRRIKDSEEPLPISLKELAAHRRLTAERLGELQNEKVVVIQFDADHRVASAESKPLPPSTVESA